MVVAHETIRPRSNRVRTLHYQSGVVWENVTRRKDSDGRGGGGGEDDDDDDDDL